MRDVAWRPRVPPGHTRYSWGADLPRQRQAASLQSTDRVQKVEAAQGVRTTGGDGGGGQSRVRVVLQRCESASLLIDNKSRWEKIPRGLIAFVSFGQGADRKLIAQAAAAVVHAPVLTLGVWGDGSGAQSLVTLAKAGGGPEPMDKPGVSVSTRIPRFGLMVIPQAALYCRLRGRKDLKYYRQLDKAQARDLYLCFVDEVIKELRRELVPEYREKESRAASEARRARGLVPLSDLFRTGSWAGRFGSFDEKGMPLTEADGQPVSKKLGKKLARVYRTHAKKIEKKKAAATSGGNGDSKRSAGGDEATAAKGQVSTKTVQPATLNEPMSDINGMVRVVAGTFGNRQGFKMTSEMGPFSHVFDL